MISKKTVCFACIAFFSITSVLTGELWDEKDISPAIFSEMSDDMSLKQMGQQSMSKRMGRQGMSKQMGQQGMSGRMNHHGMNNSSTTVKLRQQVVELAMSYQEAGAENSKTGIKEKLRKTLTQLFAQVLAEKEQDIKRLKKHIQKQEKLVSTSKIRKKQIIQKRLEKIIDANEELDF